MKYEYQHTVLCLMDISNDKIKAAFDAANKSEILRTPLLLKAFNSDSRKI